MVYNLCRIIVLMLLAGRFVAGARSVDRTIYSTERLHTVQSTRLVLLTVPSTRISGH
jgi:hypothetical protein